jgi:DnaJ-class molecular chaperone
MQNYYEVLGITPEADEGVIKGAYHNLAKTFHPDVNAGNSLAERRFKEISQAYDTLRDPKTRVAYEQGLAHQRKRTRRRISTAAMTGFATSMFSTIVISLVMIWFLTDASRHGPPDKDKSVMRPKKTTSAPRNESPRAQVDSLVQPSDIGALP